jgi:hypothetical protein
MPESAQEYTLRIICEIITRHFFEFGLPLKAIMRLSGVNRAANAACAQLLTKCARLRKKYAPVLAQRYARWLINRIIAQPINYTGIAHMEIPIINMFNTVNGAVVDPGQIPFSADFLAQNMLAISHISLRANAPLPVVFSLLFSEQNITSVFVNPDDYIDTGEIDDSLRKRYKALYVDEELYPGRYFTRLDLPTQMNPLTLLEFTDYMAGIGFQIHDAAHEIPIEDNNYTAVQISPYDPYFMGDNFTHIIIHFVTCPYDAYNWHEYALAFDADIEYYVMRRPLLRRADDPELAEIYDITEDIILSDQDMTGE